MDSGPAKPATELSWQNVGLAFGFIFFDAVVSRILGLGVGTLLVTSALRCVVQLSLVALILQRVFETNNPWGVAGIALLLNLLGTSEIVVNEARRRHPYMFVSVFASNLGSTIPVAIIGVRYAMSEKPFWQPTQFIPVVGILCGSIISGIVISVNHVLKQLHENTDKIETYLAFGASRIEACKPIAIEALRLGLTPTIIQMSVIGIIAIPGTMTGAILGGASVQQAARLQMVVMFLICGSSVLSAVVCTVVSLVVVIDAEVRVRTDRIDSRPHAVWRVRGQVVRGIVRGARAVWDAGTRAVWWRWRSGGDRDRDRDTSEEDEAQGLLG